MAALVTSSLHPGHQLMEHDYGSGEGAHYCCNLCERVIFGAGYRCADDAKCGGFDIHKACLSLPMRITFNAHREHGDLTLSLLTAGRWCGICYVYSHAGCCVYRCANCALNVHPRCTSLLDDKQQQQQQQQVEQQHEEEQQQHVNEEEEQQQQQEEEQKHEDEEEEQHEDEEEEQQQQEEEQQQHEDEEQQQHWRKRDVAKSVGKAALKVGFFGLRVADAVTGGFGSPVIDVVETALHL